MFEEKDQNNIDDGQNIFKLMEKLWPICRSITGNGVRETLYIIKKILPSMKIFEVPTKTVCYDWEIPKEWNIKDAFIIDPEGNKIVDFKKSNLHVVNYSTPIDIKIELSDLQEHLHSLPNFPESIPYVTSYYNEYWGFCLSHAQREKLKPGLYHVKIDSELKFGSLTYGELYLPGKSKKEILISTYICHPSLANNELSGPCLATYLSKWINENLSNKFSYRILFIPETIGAIYYISKNLKSLKKNTIAGFILTCVGDEKAWSFMPSRTGNTWIDKVSRNLLTNYVSKYKEYSFLERGSDERQYCSPGVDLPVVSIMRSKYGTYPEYHTSKDNLEFVTPLGLQESFNIHIKMIRALESDCFPINKNICEPMMSKIGLRPSIGKVGSANASKNIMNFLAYADGNLSLLDISNHLNLGVIETKKIMNLLIEKDLLQIKEISH